MAYEADGWGVGELVFEHGLLVWHELPRYASVDHVAQKSRPIAEQGAHPLAERLRGYFVGARDTFSDVDLDLSWCTRFQLAVLEAMRRIPYGETATYGEVAALAGHPNAQRAVGSFCAANRFALIVPCHRVIAADGLGSYGSLGPGYKSRLLELEGRDARDAALALQERSLVGSTRARANRLANEDHANLVRSGRAAHVQLEAARRLKRSGRLGQLSPRLQEIAELRLRHPSLSLRDLGARCSPPASKAAAGRRLRALVRIAEI